MLYVIYQQTKNGNVNMNFNNDEEALDFFNRLLDRLRCSCAATCATTWSSAARPRRCFPSAV